MCCNIDQLTEDLSLDVNEGVKHKLYSFLLIQREFKLLGDIVIETVKTHSGTRLVQLQLLWCRVLRRHRLIGN